MTIYRKIVFLFIINFAFYSAYSQSVKSDRANILFILDASGSMNDVWQSQKKFESAKKVLYQMMDTLNDKSNIQTAIRIFGHQTPRDQKDCKDSRLEIPFGKHTNLEIRNKIESLTPQGQTPIAYSLAQAALDFPKIAGVRNVIILISDGIENCEGDPCETSNTLQKNGIFYKPYIIGLGLNEAEKKMLDCVGKMYEVDDEKITAEIAKVVITSFLNPTSLQINLLNDFGKPTETDLNMTFYDHVSKDIRYNFYHKLTPTGFPDTLKVDAQITYDVVVHSLPPVKLENIKLTPGKHTSKGIDVGQGTLQVKITGLMKYNNLKILVHDKNNQLVNIQDINTAKKYLTDEYTLDVLTVPITHFSGVEIAQSAIKLIDIPAPGTLIVNSSKLGYTFVYSTDGARLKKVYTFNPNILRETLILQPGNYLVVYREKTNANSFETKERPIKINSSLTTNLIF